MPLTIAELYLIKCTIARSLFMGRHDWEDRINMNVLMPTNGKTKHAYLRFRAADCIVNIGSNKVIDVVTVGGRKPLKFNHQNIEETLDLIGAELSAHFKGSIDE